MKDLHLYDLIALIIVLIGGINWGLIGLINLNIITAIFGFGMFSRLIFIIVGVAAVYLAYELYVAKYKQPPTT